MRYGLFISNLTLETLMKMLLIGLTLFTSLSASASLSNGVSAVMQIIEGQQLTHAEGVKDKSDSRLENCTVEIFSHDENHMAVYVRDSGRRIGAATGLNHSSGQITFQDNKIIVKNSADKSIITLDQNNIVRKVEVKSMFGLGSTLTSQCEL